MASLTMNWVIFSLIHTLCYGQNIFIISRKSSMDVFKVPPSYCSHSAGSQCTIYHQSAFSAGDRCACSCPYSASTFGFFGSSWACMGNQALRTQFGCKVKFSLNQDGSPFKILKDDGLLKMNVQLRGNYCKIDYTKSRYVMCNETMMKFSDNPDHKNIIIAFVTRIGNSDNYRYYILIKHGTSLKGALVGLYFDCVSSCLLFKIAGEVSCKVQTRNVVNNTVITREPTTIDSQASTRISGINPSLATTNYPQGSAGELSSGVVAVVVLLVILIMITAAIIGYLCWKRKRGERVWLLEQCLHLGSKFRSPFALGKEEEHKEKEENAIYEEIKDITFIEGRTTIPDKGISLTLMSSESTPRETQEISLRQGRRSITDAEGYAVPVELQEYQYLEDDCGLMQNISQENNTSKANYGYTVPEGELPHYEKLKETYNGFPNKEAISGQHLETDYDIIETHLSDNTEKMPQQISEREMETSNIEQESSQSSAVTHQNQLKKVRRRPPSPPRKL